ncbi:MAG: sigma-54-dependent Fis family transcriptional regulator [Deltaproteobacteria bacterium]|nr:sigma-54-dependent Fis family transcriptional regulator [Deltaproteobacteria bacterium]MDQ3301157.1 sigma-54-dependent Fis family transcriptional regulator [Myxococcota bacterium]
MSDIETKLQQRPGVHVVTSLRVEVVDGPDRGVHATGGEAISVGTARDNALAIGDFTVSRYHLEAVARSGGILVTDLGSTNGTYVGAVRIERAVVPPGTLVTLGGTTIRFDDAVRRTVPATTEQHEYAGMIAQSPAMLRLFADIERIAATATSVLIVGESGTGKERVAEALHAGAGRSGEPLVTIDCGALSSSLLASELFGHERGAFTGADRTHEGAFERARGGTVFLDEIGELPSPDQSSLLGVLERRRFRRVGGSTELELGARVIAATNRDLRAEVNSGRFRHDLYHRLAVVVLRLPPLRDRREDIPALVEHFAKELGATGPLEAVFGAETLARWQRHPWPGNIRELRNAVEAALVVGPGAHLEHAASALGQPQMLPYKDARAAVVGDFEHEYLARLLADAGGNVSQAARAAKMDRSHLIDLLHRHGLKAKG